MAATGPARPIHENTFSSEPARRCASPVSTGMNKVCAGIDIDALRTACTDTCFDTGQRAGVAASAP